MPCVFIKMRRRHIYAIEWFLCVRYRYMITGYDMIWKFCNRQMDFMAFLFCIDVYVHHTLIYIYNVYIHIYEWPFHSMSGTIASSFHHRAIIIIHQQLHWPPFATVVLAHWFLHPPTTIAWILLLLLKLFSLLHANAIQFRGMSTITSRLIFAFVNIKIQIFYGIDWIENHLVW